MTHNHVQKKPPKKALSGLDATLYTISAILLIDQVALSAAVGEAALFWWVVVLVLFLIPNTLVTAELGTTYPEQGGIYAWISRAFGQRWGARVTWLYWINIALWMPAVFIMFAGMMTLLFFPDMTLWQQIAVGVSLCWLVAAVNCLPLRLSKWLPNIAPPLKLLVILILGIGGLIYGTQHGFANDISLSHALSDLSVGLAYIPVIVYGCLGVELVSAESQRIHHPQRNIPRAMLGAGVITSLLYVFGTLGVLAAVPADEVDTVDVIAVTVQALFSHFGLGAEFTKIIGAVVLFTFFATLVTWTLGGNRAMAEAAVNREMPAILGWQHAEHQAPIGAALMTSLISSIVLIIYGLLASNAEELFWTLFAFSAIIFLLPYVGMHLAFQTLRNRLLPADTVFRIPGPHWVGTFLSCNCILILCSAILLFFWIPGEPLDLVFALQVSISILLTLGIGEWLVRQGEQRRIKETSDRESAESGMITNRAN